MKTTPPFPPKSSNSSVKTWIGALAIAFVINMGFSFHNKTQIKNAQLKQAAALQTAEPTWNLTDEEYFARLSAFNVTTAIEYSDLLRDFRMTHVEFRRALETNPKEIERILCNASRALGYAITDWQDSATKLLGYEPTCKL